jgi:hypothetical protein
VEGYNQDDSYMYPGGAKFEFINPGDDDTPPVCTGTLTGTTYAGTATDLLTDDPENTGIFFVELGAGSTNLTLAVTPFVPGAQSVSYTVTRTDPGLDGSGSVVATDGAGNTCSVTIFIPADGGPVDTSPPVCGAIVPEFQGPGGALSAVTTTATDPESGIASVLFLTLRNMSGFVDGNGPFAEGGLYNTPSPDPTTVTIRGERISYLMGGGIIVRVTNGAGLERNCDPVTAQVGATPEAYALEDVRPNPIRTTAEIRFSVPEATHVRLVVYDLTGRAVATLVDWTMEPGVYAVTWSGTDEVGRALASGVYVYRMEAGSFTASRRLTLVR